MSVILNDPYELDGTSYAAGEPVSLPQVVEERLILSGQAVAADDATARLMPALSAHAADAVVPPSDDLAAHAFKPEQSDAEFDAEKDPADCKVAELKAELKARKVPGGWSDLKHDELAELVAKYREDKDYALDTTPTAEQGEGLLASGDGISNVEGRYRYTGTNPVDPHLHPLGEASFGDALVESGAIVNTGGPNGPARAALDAELVTADRERSLSVRAHTGDAVVEAGAVRNTGGPRGDGGRGHVPGASHHNTVIDDGVPRSDLGDVTDNRVARLNPVGEADGVPRSDLSSLAADEERWAKERESHRAEIDAERAELDGSDGGALGTADVPGLVHPERVGTVQEPARPSTVGAGSGGSRGIAGAPAGEQAKAVKTKQAHAKGQS